MSARLFFFEVDPLPGSCAPADMLDKLEAEDANDLDTCRTLSAMDLAMNSAPLEEWAVDDFALRLFDMLGYTYRNLSVRIRKDTEVVICGTSMHATADVCLLMSRV